MISHFPILDWSRMANQNALCEHFMKYGIHHKANPHQNEGKIHCGKCATPGFARLTSAEWKLMSTYRVLTKHCTKCEFYELQLHPRGIEECAIWCDKCEDAFMSPHYCDVGCRHVREYGMHLSMPIYNGFRCKDCKKPGDTLINIPKNPSNMKKHCEECGIYEFAPEHEECHVFCDLCQVVGTASDHEWCILLCKHISEFGIHRDLHARLVDGEVKCPICLEDETDENRYGTDVITAENLVDMNKAGILQIHCDDEECPFYTIPKKEPTACMDWCLPCVKFHIKGDPDHATCYRTCKHLSEEFPSDTPFFEVGLTYYCSKCVPAQARIQGDVNDDHHDIHLHFKWCEVCGVQYPNTFEHKECRVFCEHLLSEGRYRDDSVYIKGNNISCFACSDEDFKKMDPESIPSFYETRCSYCPFFPPKNGHKCMPNYCPLHRRGFSTTCLGCEVVDVSRLCELCLEYKNRRDHKCTPCSNGCGYKHDHGSCIDVDPRIFMDLFNIQRFPTVALYSHTIMEHFLETKYDITPLGGEATFTEQRGIYISSTSGFVNVYAVYVNVDCDVEMIHYQTSMPMPMHHIQVLMSGPVSFTRPPDAKRRKLSIPSAPKFIHHAQSYSVEKQISVFGNVDCMENVDSFTIRMLPESDGIYDYPIPDPCFFPERNPIETVKKGRYSVRLYIKGKGYLIFKVKKALTDYTAKKIGKQEVMCFGCKVPFKTFNEALFNHGIAKPQRLLYLEHCKSGEESTSYIEFKC